MFKVLDLFYAMCIKKKSGVVQTNKSLVILCVFFPEDYNKSNQQLADFVYRRVRLNLNRKRVENIVATGKNTIQKEEVL
jgi:hypothetical protein